MKKIIFWVLITLFIFMFSAPKFFPSYFKRFELRCSSPEGCRFCRATSCDRSFGFPFVYYIVDEDVDESLSGLCGDACPKRYKFGRFRFLLDLIFWMGITGAIFLNRRSALFYLSLGIATSIAMLGIWYLWIQLTM